MRKDYLYKEKDIKGFIQEMYDDGLQKSLFLNEDQIYEIINNIGIFKLKGYYFAFRSNVKNYTIDDVLFLFFFDKYLTKVVMDLTSSIETKLKMLLVDLSYKQIKKLPQMHQAKYNPFFYLMEDCYKKPKPSLKSYSLYNWKEVSQTIPSEMYTHYCIYYKTVYDFSKNKMKHLDNCETIPIEQNINYPPFHYFVESSTLGTITYLVKNLKIGTYDILKEIAKAFGINNPNNINFITYIERLNEIRNRAAHRERIFNRSYRSVSRVGKYQLLSVGIDNHKFIDLYMFLFYMLNRLDNYVDTDNFINDEFMLLFKYFKEDYFVNKDTKGLIRSFNEKEFDKMKDFILGSMR